MSDSWVTIMLNPAKYGYTVCPRCHGYGSALDEQQDRCSNCGGTGLVPKTPDRDDG